MLPKKPEKPKIETKEHDVNPGKDQDVIVKIAGFRLYFQNYYTIISLANDLFTGILYLAGSLVQTFTDLDRLGMYLYIFASFFLLMRPVLKIAHNVFFYDEKEYEEKVLGKSEEASNEEEKPSKEVEVKSEDESDETEETDEEETEVSRETEAESGEKGSNTKDSNEIERGYNDDYYESQEKKE